jgi:mannitol/fructose-specific phosphotransferase system IIA component (Ntr-type)
MAEVEKDKTVSLQELMVSTLAMTDALAKLLIEKGVITDAEFKEKLLQERGVYQRILNPTVQ